MGRVLFLFVDGLGLGEDDPAVNPVAAAALPALTTLLDGRKPLRHEAPFTNGRTALAAADPSMGVPGLPQSGTGQAALLTGENAAIAFGRHQGPWVPTALRDTVRQRSILRRTLDAGRSAAFANAYPEELMERVRRDGGDRSLGPLRAGPPLAAMGAGLLNRHTPELERGEALSSEITNDTWRKRLGRTALPDITPRQAGHNLARLSARHNLTLFAHYATDYMGHRGTFDEAVASLERLDTFLAGVLDELPADALLVLASDHGNIEDVRGEHTGNPAIALFHGLGADGAAAGVEGLTDVAGVVMQALAP